MTVLFTEEEREWIDRVDFNWSIDPDCPESLVGPIKAKLALLYGQEEKPQDAAEAENYNHDYSAQPLDNSVNSGRMNTDDPPQNDGGPGSGNRGHRGNPGHRGGSLPKVAAGTISSAIENGEISTKLDGKKQSKHRKGSKRYNEAVARGDKVSFFTISDSEIQQIITKKAGTGTGYGKNGHYKETVDAEKTVGVYAGLDGNERASSRLTIHYAKSGCHAVPATPK